MTASLNKACAHCGAVGTLVGNACYDCAVVCAEPGCDQPADPAEVGGFCPRHVPDDNTLPVEEPGPSPTFTVEDA